MITLSDGTTTLQLHPDLMWSDEFNWQPVEQAAEFSVTGALIVQEAAKQAGRPITLEPEDDNSAWMLRDTIEQLRNWAAEAGKTLELTLRGVPRSVIFRRTDGPGVEARPVAHYSEMEAADFYLATFRFMEI